MPILDWVPVASLLASIAVWVWGASRVVSLFDTNRKENAQFKEELKKYMDERQGRFEAEQKKRQADFETRMESLMLPECKKTFKELHDGLEKVGKGVASLDGKLDGILAVVTGSHKKE